LGVLLFIHGLGWLVASLSPYAFPSTDFGLASITFFGELLGGPGGTVVKLQVARIILFTAQMQQMSSFYETLLASSGRRARLEAIRRGRGEDRAALRSGITGTQRS
jgi:hypothetical protein